MTVNLAPLTAMQRGFVRPKHNGPAVTQPEPPKRPERQYIAPVAWDLRVHRWLRSWAVVARDFDKGNRWPRWSRVKLWVFGRSAHTGLYERTRQMLIAITGGRVSHDIYVYRMHACLRQCKKVTIRLPRRPDGVLKFYCGSCACPRWPLSELRRKNKYRKWHCPERRHPGPYPGDWLQALLAKDREQREGE